VVQQVFDRDFIGKALAGELESIKAKISQATLKRDVECCIRSYVPRANSDSPEDLSGRDEKVGKTMVHELKQHLLL
jgi:hypothetical protein